MRDDRKYTKSINGRFPNEMYDKMDRSRKIEGERMGRSDPSISHKCLSWPRFFIKLYNFWDKHNEL